MKINPDNHRSGTLLGELIAAASETAFEYCDEGKDAYDLTRLFFLVETLKTARGADVDRARALRVGDYLTIEGRLLDGDRFKLENFLRNNRLQPYPWH